MVSLRPACFLALGTTPARESIQSGRKKVGQRRSTCAIGSALKQSLRHQQKADAVSITSLPEVLASRLVNCPAISSLARRDRATALRQVS
jgi:hypothetical protein